MTVEIALSGGQIALVDDQDAAWVQEHKWCLTGGKKGRYAGRGVANGKRRRTTVYLHRLILPVPRGIEIDHINGNTLDNRRCNLRQVTHAQNAQNRWCVNSRSTTGLRGVTFDARRASRPYKACVWINGQVKYGGRYASPGDAALAAAGLRAQYHTHASECLPEGEAK